jgi:hypothetical protein
MGNHLPEIELPGTLGETEKNRAFRRIGPEDLVKDGLQEQNAKSLKSADECQQHDSRKPLEPEGQSIPQKAQKILHAGLPACRVKISAIDHWRLALNSMLVLYPAGADIDGREIPNQYAFSSTMALRMVSGWGRIASSSTGL